ncbi:hypothetical protein NP493_575g01042 [Ridgeia piscesae]|uniref:Uncharacterized protein n=1 Tax=Ridgeia piscesae TaxID=27915 RepID=A0AAD9KUE9_RIDPI|nr:hypothetical protein NP493_575g01042 [Ridgeia piscesae]
MKAVAERPPSNPSRIPRRCATLSGVQCSGGGLSVASSHDDSRGDHCQVNDAFALHVTWAFSKRPKHLVTSLSKSPLNGAKSARVHWRREAPLGLPEDGSSFTSASPSIPTSPVIFTPPGSLWSSIAGRTMPAGPICRAHAGVVIDATRVDMRVDT